MTPTARKPLYTIAILLLLCITACQKQCLVASKLLQAEALMYTHPDSALQMLEAIPEKFNSILTN